MRTLKHTTKFYSLALFCALFALSHVSYGQDKHIDPAADRTLHKISFSKHVNVTNTTINAATLDAVLKFGSDELQKCDDKVNDEQDVACQVSFERDGAVTTFGSAGDLLDVIDNITEFNTVVNYPGFVHFVTALMYNGGIQTGLTSPNSNDMVLAEKVTNARSVSEYGQTFVHEFGHAQGIVCHRGEAGCSALIGKPFMHPEAGPYYEVNQAECKAFHNGFLPGTPNGKNRPVNLLVLFDDTGSMTEEIENEKAAIIKALSNPLFVPGSCDRVYQLVTFKDVATPYAPTTDLSLIISQVGNLVASGGDDCPEGSAEALSTAGENVMDKGHIIIVTDASTHAGFDIESAKNALRARGIGVHTQLSGDCSAGTLTLGAANGQTGFPYSNNAGANLPGISPATVLPSDPTAVQVFSYLAEETGGDFVFVPEVNSGLAADKTRYENIGYNFIIGSIAPAITNLEPRKSPVGGTIALTVSSSKTEFNSSTELSFNDPGIIVQSVNVISPRKILALINTAPGVSLGFKDIKATTLTGGTVQVADGIGLLEIVSAPVSPTILSISPSSGKTGETLNVKVTGINTHFSDASVLNLGSDITVLSSSAPNLSELDAQIKISPSAITGFKNVSVITGSETAAENVPGPFLVIATPCAPPVFDSISAVCFNAAPVNLSALVNPKGGIFSGPGVIDSIFNPSVAGEGTHVISYIYSSGSCTPDSVSQTITVYPQPVASVSASSPNTFCNKLTLSASSTLTGPFTFEWTFGAIPFAGGPSIELDNLNNDGVYSVFATDGHGCKSKTSACYNYMKQNQINNYTILAFKRSHLDLNNKVQTGSVGVTANNGIAQFSRFDTVSAPGAFVKAKYITMMPPSSIPNRILSRVNVGLPAMQYNTANTYGLPSYNVNANASVTLNGNYRNLVINKGAVAILTGNTFGNIIISERAKVTFTQSDINVEKLVIEKGRGIEYTTVKFTADANVRVRDQVKLEEKVRVNDEGKKVTFFVGASPCNEQKFMVKANDTRVTANVYIPYGDLRIVAANSFSCGGVSNAGLTSYMTGIFIAETIDGQGKNIVWNNYNCSTSPAPLNREFVSPVREIDVDKETELMVAVSPNPSSSSFRVVVSSNNKQAPVTIRISDVSGKYQELKQNILPGTYFTVGAELSKGIYFGEVMQGTKRKTFKLIKN